MLLEYELRTEMSARLKENHQYWKTRRGKEYRQQQAGRAASGDDAYARQEGVVTEWVRRVSKSVERPRILDFGCGYGRMLAAIRAGGGEYFGYDFSEAMVGDGTASAEFEEQRQSARVRVGDSLECVFGDHEFDGILSVSVMIHNAPGDVCQLMRMLAKRLKPTGEILLIENPIISGSAKANLWHAGCWMHDFSEHAAGIFDVAVDPGILGKHGLYVLKSLPGERTKSDLHLLDWPSGARTRITKEEWDQRGAAMSEIAKRTMSEEIEHLDLLAATHHDVVERQRTLEAELASVREALAEAQLGWEAANAKHQRLAEELLQIKERVIPANDRLVALQNETIESLKARVTLTKRFEQAFLSQGAGLSHATEHPRETDRASPEKQAFLIDAPQDTKYAEHIDAFDCVVHCFHQEWFGIRAACGAMPGRKLAITADRAFPPAAMRDCIEALCNAGVRKLVMHGMSPNAATLLKALRSAAGGIDLFGVWHGSLGQAWDDVERGLWYQAVGFAQDGTFKRFSSLRAGGEIVAPRNYFRPLLLNPPPSQTQPSLPTALPFALPRAVALVPGWPNAYKNVYANVLAAEQHPAIAQTLMYAACDLGRIGLDRKVKRIFFGGLDSHFELLRTVDITLCATFIDCHPVAPLEALAVGRPAVMGPLFLDALSDHEVTRICTAANPLSVSDIASAIERVRSYGPAFGQLAYDYCAKLRGVSTQRYADFVEL